jgi:hypothetical protein
MMIIPDPVTTVGNPPSAVAIFCKNGIQLKMYV